MKRRAFQIIGLLAAILGLTLVVDTALADGVCACCCAVTAPCPHNAASGDGESCASGPDVPICKNSATAESCQNNQKQRYEVKKFPKSCVSTFESSKCDSEDDNCKRPTDCTWDKKLKECVKKTGEADWASASRRKTYACP